MGAVREVRVPPELSARVPPARRDGVRMVTGRRAGGAVGHHVFGELPGLLRAGDVLVVNTSRTLPAALDAVLEGAPVVVHFSALRDDGCWVVELREADGHGTTRPRAGGPAGAVVGLPGGRRLVLRGPLRQGAQRLWVAEFPGGDAVRFLYRYGRPIRYAYTARDQPLSAYQTVLAVP